MGVVHLIGQPMSLASQEYADKCWTTFVDIPAFKGAKNVRFVQGTAKTIDLTTRTATVFSSSTTEPVEISYDYCVVATGLRRTWPTVPKSMTKAEYLRDNSAHLQRILAAKEKEGVVVVGGGAVGVEIASELKLLHPDVKVTLVHSRSRLLSAEPLPDKFAEKTLELLREQGVEVLLSHRVGAVELVWGVAGSPGEVYSVSIGSGETIRANVVITAISHQIPTGKELLPEGCVDGEGWVRINPNLTIQGLEGERHFCAGDTVKWSGIKRAGAAMWMGFLAGRNMHSRMMVERGLKKKGEGEDLRLEEIPAMMALAVGDSAVNYRAGENGKEGETTWGKEVREMMFNDDLGWGICWNYMKLGEEYKP